MVPNDQSSSDYLEFQRYRKLILPYMVITITITTTSILKVTIQMRKEKGLTLLLNILVSSFLLK